MLMNMGPERIRPRSCRAHRGDDHTIEDHSLSWTLENNLESTAMAGAVARLGGKIA